MESHDDTNELTSRTNTTFISLSIVVRHARNQWRYIHHVIAAYPLLWARIICKFNVYNVYGLENSIQPRRNVGHHRLRSDDHVNVFCWKR